MINKQKGVVSMQQGSPMWYYINEIIMRQGDQYITNLKQVHDCERLTKDFCHELTMVDNGGMLHRHAMYSLNERAFIAQVTHYEYSTQIDTPLFTHSALLALTPNMKEGYMDLVDTLASEVNSQYMLAKYSDDGYDTHPLELLLSRKDDIRDIASQFLI